MRQVVVFLDRGVELADRPREPAGGKPEKSSRKSSAAPEGRATRPVRGAPPADTRSVNLSRGERPSRTPSLTLVKPVASNILSRAEPGCRRVSRGTRLLPIGSGRVVPATPNPIDDRWTTSPIVLALVGGLPDAWFTEPVLPPDVARDEVRRWVDAQLVPLPLAEGPRGPRLGGSARRDTRGAAGHPRPAGGLAAVVAAPGASQGDPPARRLYDREADVRELARHGGPRPPLCTRADPPGEGPRRRQHQRAPLPGEQGGRLRAGQERQPGPARLRGAVVRLHELLRAAHRRRRRRPRPGPARRRQRPRHHRLLVQRAVPDDPGDPRRPPRARRPGGPARSRRGPARVHGRVRRVELDLLGRRPRRPGPAQRPGLLGLDLRLLDRQGPQLGLAPAAPGGPAGRRHRRAPGPPRPEADARHDLEASDRRPGVPLGGGRALLPVGAAGL